MAIIGPSGHHSLDRRKEGRGGRGGGPRHRRWAEAADEASRAEEVSTGKDVSNPSPPGSGAWVDLDGSSMMTEPAILDDGL